MQIAELLDWLAELAPLELSESWDNTGLLLGDRRQQVSRVMACLTITTEVVAEAVAQQADLIVAHHPLPFRPIQQLTTDTQVGELLWRLAKHGISIYAPHTAWDSAPRGINQRLATLLGLSNVRPIVAAEPPLNRAKAVRAEVSEGALPFTAQPDTPLGAGRIGDLDSAGDLDSLAKCLQSAISGCRLRGVRGTRRVQRVAIACGSGGSLLEGAVRAGCDLFVTGEATYHTCLEARAADISLLMIGHYASERFAMEELASELQGAFPELACWASSTESDPVQNITV